jgi:predicted dehydrogenase
MSLRSPEVVVAGAGPMAGEHVRALLAHGVSREHIIVAARRVHQAEHLAAVYGVRAGALGQVSASTAIVAVTEDALVPVARALLARGATRMLIEKPGALSSDELRELVSHDGIFVAYNRRFYTSVVRARQLVEQDGGAIAATFDFTEIERLVLADAKRRNLPEAVLQRWGLANSLHVIDLAFFLAGDPVELTTERSGSLPWHAAGARFSGSGTTDRDGVFSYLASWDGAGRWNVEVTTRARRLFLQPLEQLREQLRGSFESLPLVVTAATDGVKPGLAGQLAAFLDGDTRSLCGVAAAVGRLELAERMLGYG